MTMATMEHSHGGVEEDLKDLDLRKVFAPHCEDEEFEDEEGDEELGDDEEWVYEDEDDEEGDSSDLNFFFFGEDVDRCCGRGGRSCCGRGRGVVGPQLCEPEIFTARG